MTDDYDRYKTDLEAFNIFSDEAIKKDDKDYMRRCIQFKEEIDKRNFPYRTLGTKKPAMFKLNP